MRILARSLLHGVSVLLLFPCVVLAQASIGGTVRDTSGAVLPGVVVEASSPALIEKVRSVVTDGSGQYLIVDLRPGMYTVTFTLAGFNTVRREGLELSGSFAASVNIEMRVGTLEETITVSGEAPVVDVQTVLQQRVLKREVIDAIPTGRSQYTLAVLVPGVTSTSQDVGGTASGGAVRLQIHGGRLGDTRQMVEGFTIAAQEGLGQFSGYMINIGSSQELAIDTGGGSAAAETGGIQINAIPREGGNRLTGSFFGNTTFSGLIGSNLTDDLKNRGLPTPATVEKIYDINPGIGGPILRDKLWFFLSLRWTKSTTAPAGAFYNKNAGQADVWTYELDQSRPAFAFAYQHSFNNRFTIQPTPKHKFAFFFDDQTRITRNASATVLPEATSEGGFPRQSFATLTWSAPVTNRVLYEAGIMWHREGWKAQSEFDPALIAVTEQSTGVVYHGQTTSNFTTMPNYRALVMQTRGSMSYVTGSHAVKVGFDDKWGYRNETLNDNAYSTLYRFNNGVPNLITQKATPALDHQNIKMNLGIYAQDRWSLRRTTLNVGLRYDYFNSYYPEQHLGPATLVPNRNLTFPRTAGNRWHDITPRLGVNYDVFANGKTALKASAGRFVAGQALQGVFGNQNNPVIRTAIAVTRSWNDANRNYAPDCDLTNVLANGECGTVSDTNFGKPTTSTVYDPETMNGWGKRQYNWEFSAGVQQELVPRVSAEFGYFRRIFGNHMAYYNRATSFNDYTKFEVTAPVDPRLPGGGGYTVGPLYDLNPDKVGVVDGYLTFAKNLGKETEHWNGVDVSVNARFGRSVMQGGFSTGRTTTDFCDVIAEKPEVRTGASITDNNLGALPSTSVAAPYCKQNTGFITQFKGLGSYTVPKVDVQLSATLQSSAGPTANYSAINGPAVATGITADYVATNAIVAPSLGRNLSSATNVVVPLVAPGQMFGDRVNQLDVRIAKVFAYRTTRSTVGFEIYNALNASPVTALSTSYATWLRPQNILTARFAKLSVQFDF